MELRLERSLAWIGALTALCATVAAITPPEKAQSAAAPPARPAPHAASKTYVTIPMLPLDALVGAASNVLYARVVAATPVVRAGVTPHVDYELEVFASIKHDVGARSHVGVAGVRTAERTLSVPGAPTFELGEEVVLLTCETGADAPPGILGLGLGTYRVVSDTPGGLLARNDRTGEAMPLGTLFTRIENALNVPTISRPEAK